MTLETHLARVNQNIFYKEFSFSRNQFSPRQETQLEFADHVIWLDDLLITFQLKERELSGHHTRETEVKWYEKKVIGLATSQIRDTLNYLGSYEEINIRNEKGHVFNVVSSKLNEPINVVSYSAHDLLPQEYKRRKYHLSSSAGFIHLIPIDDWVGICQSLITPAEIREYLEFRKKISTEHKEKVNSLPEQALMGQFLYGTLDLAPGIDFLKYLELFDKTRAEFDLSHILRIFADRIVKIIEVSPGKGGDERHQYYQILKELAKLNRNELREFKFRYELCIEDCKNKRFTLPYRVTFPRTGCGFVFLTVKPQDVAATVNALKGFTAAHKYDQKLNRCIGVSFFRDGEFFDIGWCYIDAEWAYDSQMEYNLKVCFPFRSVKEENRPRYNFLGELPKP